MARFVSNGSAVAEWIEGDARYFSVSFLISDPSIILLSCSAIAVVTGTFSINLHTNAEKN